MRAVQEACRVACAIACAIVCKRNLLQRALAQDSLKSMSHYDF